MDIFQKKNPLTFMCVLGFLTSKAISPGNSVCRVCCAVETLCKLRALTCPPHPRLSVSVYDHVPGIDAL